ncbi:MAG: hypothetical protein PVG49_16740 [Desulfobacteraceae bacterium]|jgi:hypothetical protein
MAKPKKRIDAKQMSFLDRDYDSKIEEYVALKTEILGAPPARDGREAQSWEEDCIEIAAAIKAAIKASGLSRQQVVDAVNILYGWPADSPKKSGEKKPRHLSIHMFNHYLSKPVEYPIPSYLIFAIQRVTSSLVPCIAFAEAEGAQVISGDEVRQMRLGKLDDTLIEMQRLKKALREKR